MPQIDESTRIDKILFLLNMYGVCDANTEFIAITCEHVGSINDMDAFRTSAI
jgi:hypothetical protein